VARLKSAVPQARKAPETRAAPESAKANAVPLRVDQVVAMMLAS